MSLKFTPASALEAQHELFAFTQSRKGFQYLQAFLNIPESFASQLQRSQVAMLRGGPTYFVASDMLALARHAAASMPALPLSAKDFISPSGVVIFEKAVIVEDIKGKDTTLAGFCWYPSRHANGNMGVVWNFLSDTQDNRDYYMRKQREEGIRIEARLLPLAIRFEGFGETPATPAETAEAAGGGVEKAEETITLLRLMPLCLFLLMGQTITETTTERPQRQTRRRLARLKSPLADTMIKVVKLRRIKARLETGGEPKVVDWSHRWVVNGHWRMQPTKDGPKRIWIMPFVKGAEHLPLKLKETVYVLER